MVQQVNGIVHQMITYLQEGNCESVSSKLKLILGDPAVERGAGDLEEICCFGLVIPAHLHSALDHGAFRCVQAIEVEIIVKGEKRLRGPD